MLNVLPKAYLQEVIFLKNKMALQQGSLLQERDHTAFIICQSSPEKMVVFLTDQIKRQIKKGPDNNILIELPTYPGTNCTWFISDIRYLQSSDLFSRSNALCKLCLRVTISFCSVNKHLTCPILPIFLRYFISSMASPSIKLN